MPTEIISGLWIGEMDSSFDIPFLKDNNITILINCTLDYGFPDIKNISKWLAKCCKPKVHLNTCTLKVIFTYIITDVKIC